MFLIRLIYASKIADICTGEHIQQIMETSKINNKEINITGVLCYNNEYFLQCLEGSRIRVNQLYHKILLDERHEDPAILKYEEILERDFMEWSMGYIPPAKISGQMVLKYSGDTHFNPYSMSGEGCHMLLKALAELHLTR